MPDDGTVNSTLNCKNLGKHVSPHEKNWSKTMLTKLTILLQKFKYVSCS